MRKIVLSDEFISALIEKIKSSGKREEIESYVSETADKCAKLCEKGESLRIFSEYRFLIENLIKELGL